MKVAIVGAGVSGLSAAYLLLQRDEKLTVEVFEKSKGLGGRMATRRMALQFPVDTGCQFISIDQPKVRDFFESALDKGALLEIPQPILCLPDGFVVDTKNRFFMEEGMTAWAKSIVKRLEAFGGRFKLHLEKEVRSVEDLGAFDTILVSVPGAEAKKLGAKESVEYRPCLSLVFSWHEAHELVQSYFAFRDISGREGVVWLCHEGTKRKQPGLWLAQVSGEKSVEWNEKYIKGDKNFDDLEDIFQEDLTLWAPSFAEGEKTLVDAKFWQDAFPVQFSETDLAHAFEKSSLGKGRSLYFMGDGYRGVGRVENAIESAMSTVDDLLGPSKAH